MIRETTLPVTYRTQDVEMRNMRVLMICWEYPPHIVGGMGKHTADLAPVLAAQGVEVHLITPQVRGGLAYEQPAHQLHVHRLPVPALNGAGFVEQVRQANCQEFVQHAANLAEQVGGFNLIHAHEWLSAPSAIELKHRFRVPLVATIHATERGRARGALVGDHAQQIDALEWELIYQAWRVIVCSQFMANQLRECFTTPSDKIDVVANGINPTDDPFVDLAERQAFRRRFAADDQPLIFSVGRIVFEKGLHVLLDSLPRVCEQFPATRLVIAGSGPVLGELEQRMRDLNLTDRVQLAGFISDEDRDRLFRVSDVAVFPSLYEPFGIVALEAMAAGCPLVIAATGGLVEVVTHGQTGLAARTGDAQDLAVCITETLAEPVAARYRADRARQHAAQTFSWGQIAAETRDVYQRVFHEWKQSDWHLVRG